MAVFTLTFAIVALGAGMGAVFPRFDVENPAHIPTGLGGIFYMITSLGVIGVTLLLLARPVHILLVSRVHEVSPTTAQWAEIAAIYILIAGFHYLVVHLSMNRGCRALNAIEL